MDIFFKSKMICFNQHYFRALQHSPLAFSGVLAHSPYLCVSSYSSAVLWPCIPCMSSVSQFQSGAAPSNVHQEHHGATLSGRLSHLRFLRLGSWPREGWAHSIPLWALVGSGGGGELELNTWLIDIHVVILFQFIQHFSFHCRKIVLTHHIIFLSVF